MKKPKKLKPTLKAKSTAKVGSASKPGPFSNPTKLFRVVLVASAAVLLLSTISYTGFSKYQERTLKSKAGTYGRVIYQNGFTASACKIMTPYGYKLRVIATKPANTRGKVSITVNTASNKDLTTPGIRTSAGAGFQWWGNVVTSVDTYGGNDNWWYYIYIHTDWYGLIYSGMVSMAYTPYC